MNLISLAKENYRKFGEFKYMVYDDREFTNLEMMGYAKKLAGGFQSLGIKRGDIVLVMLPNCPEVLISYQGIVRCGAAIAPVVPTLTENELAHILTVSEAACIVTGKDMLKMIRSVQGRIKTLKHVIVEDKDAPKGTIYFWDLVNNAEPIESAYEVSEDDLAVILFTAGTTGMPKGVMLSHRNLSANALSMSKVRGTTSSDVFLISLPLSHSFGLTTMNIGFLYNYLHVLMRRFNPEEAFRLIEKQRVTFFSGVPAMFAMMLNHPESGKYDLSSLKNCICGSAPLPAQLLQSFQEKFNCIIREGYGLSEASPALSMTYYDRPQKVASIGQPIPDVKVRIVDENDHDVAIGEVGELIACGPNVSSMGYYKLPEETAKTFKKGWVYTGDMARKDDDGYLFIVERKKDMIIRGGFNIYPRDVEEVLYRYPAIQDAVAVGIPHDILGEEVKVFVVLKPGQKATAEDILTYCRENIAKHQMPKYIEFLNEMPRNPMGKILRKELRKIATS